MALGIIKTLGLAGAALTAWYFLDPKNGADRRDRFSKNAKDMYDSAGKELKGMYDTAGKELNRVSKDVAGVVTDTVDRVSKIAEDFTAGRGESASASGAAKSTPVSIQ